MDDDQQFCLRWNNHQSTLISVFDTLLESETLVDCTLFAEGKFLKAHKVVLSACSPYFATLLQEQYDKHPIFILKDVKFPELRAMMDYMYRGEVNISQDQLAALLKAAESLQIKGLSDNRSGGGIAPKHEQQQQQQHHRGSSLNVPISAAAKMSAGYTLEQTKRARIGPSAMDVQEMTASREGSSSPSRRRRKVRRRSIENAMADVHDNSNSSQMQAANQTSSILQQTNASLAGVGAITAAASVLASQIPVTAGLSTAAAASVATSGTMAAAITQGTNQQQQQQQQQQLTTSVTKKTESVKGTSDAMNTDNVQAAGAVVADMSEDLEATGKLDKQNHKQKLASAAALGKDTTSDLVIEPKSEYDDEGNDETVEDLTLDDEDMGMDDLDHNAGTSQGGEGSSQGYAPWQHDRSQDELLLATQEAQQQRDPQDLSRSKPAVFHKENKAPQILQPKSLKIKQRSILNVQNTRRVAGALGGVRLISQPPNAALAAAIERQKLDVTDVTDNMFGIYQHVKAPKNQSQKQLGQTSPTSAETNEASTIAAIATASAAAGVIKITETASKNLNGGEMMTKQSKATTRTELTTAASNTNASFQPRNNFTYKPNNTSNNTNLNNTPATGIITPDENDLRNEAALAMTAMRKSVVVPTSPNIDVKPVIDPVTGLIVPTPVTPLCNAASVIKPVPPAAAIAAALLRDGYHSFQQRLRAQEILRQQQLQNHVPRKKLPTADAVGIASSSGSNNNAEATQEANLLINLLQQKRKREQEKQQQQKQREQQRQQTQSNINEQQYAAEADDDDDYNDNDTNDGDDEDESSRFDDIHLMEAGAAAKSTQNSFSEQLFSADMATTNLTAEINPADYLSDDTSQKFMLAAQAQALHNLKYALGAGGEADYVGGNASNMSVGSADGTISPTALGPDGEPVYECRHCGKRYRWKSTLRRHENVECGGKEPSHQCPYCPYKSKQRGNLGVHVRKHHSNLPQLASKRRSKYSTKLESDMYSNHNSTGAGGSDDSNSKLVMDYSKFD